MESNGKAVQSKRFAMAFVFVANTLQYTKFKQNNSKLLTCMLNTKKKTENMNTRKQAGPMALQA